MKKKLLLLIATALVGGILFTGCGKERSDNSNSVSSDIVSELKKSLATLKAEDSYLVRTVMEAPDGNAGYLEVVNKGGSYTEYPVDNEGNVSDIDKTDGYSLVDWVDVDGKSWMLQSDESGNVSYIKLPDSYGKTLLSRNVGYFDKMVDSFTDIQKKSETVSGDIGDGNETFTIYKAKLPSSKVKEILGVTTYGLYNSCKEDSKTSDAVKKLCGFYMDELDMSLTFSDAKVTIAVSDDKIRQITLETGGLGTRLYLTKSFLMKSEYELREKPDFSEAIDYQETLKNTAELIKDYDSYEEALENISMNTVKDTDKSEINKDEQKEEESTKNE